MSYSPAAAAAVAAAAAAAAAAVTPTVETFENNESCKPAIVYTYSNLSVYSI